MVQGASVGVQEIYKYETFQRYVLKRILGLPAHTPNYVLYLETGKSLLRQSVFNLQTVEYVLKTLENLITVSRKF